MTDVIAYLSEFNAVTVMLRVLLAGLAGALVGLEREFHGRAAGMRTHMMVALGAALTAMIGLYTVSVLGIDSDPLRVGAQVISGVGFLGAGTILLRGGGSRITGLTTAAGLWTAASIGLAVGMIINTLIFPYDNSRQIRRLVDIMDEEIIHFLEDMFDGDDVLPDSKAMTCTIDDMARQLRIFSNQRLILHLRRQKEELEQFRLCEGKARELLARMEVLSRMGRPGRLSDENRQRLKACGAEIRDKRVLKNPQERDMVTNYHVRQILTLRTDILNAIHLLNQK